MNVVNILLELRRRRVFRVAGLYLIGTWAVLQVVDVIADPLRLPAWTMVLTIYLAAGGFPLALFLGWRYQITDDGIVRTKEVETEDGSTYLELTLMDHTIIGVVIILFAVLVYGLVTEGVDVETPVAGETVKTLSNSIAVLPFENLGSDQTHLGDGISETVIHVLSQINGLNVTARTSSFAFRHQNQSISEIAMSLGVETVLEGSVQKASDKVRIIARLIRASTGTELWSGFFDREFSDIFAIQDEIAREVVTALKISVIDQAKEKLTERYRPELAAYEQLILGRNEFRKETVEGFAAAEEHFRKAIDLDPRYALPYVHLSETYQKQYRIKGMTVTDLMQMQRPLLTKALDLNPLLAEAHHAWAATLLQEKNFDGAEKSLIRAIELSPSYAAAYSSYAVYFVMLGRLEPALEKARTSVELDPESNRNHLMLANILWQLGRAEEAIATLKDSISRQPELARNYGQLARWSLQQGHPGLAMIYTRKQLSLDAGNPTYQWAVCLMHLQMWDKPAGRECTRAFLERYPKDREAKTFAAMLTGDRDLWLESTRQGYEESPTQWYRRNQYADTQAYVGDWEGLLETLSTTRSKLTSKKPVINDGLLWEARLIAQALQETGEREQAETILLGILKHIDRSRKMLGGGFSNGIDDVFALSLLGETEEAFRRLDAAIDNKWSFYSWDFDETPALRPLAGDPRLVQAHARMARHMESERDWYVAHQDDPVDNL